MVHLPLVVHLMRYVLSVLELLTVVHTKMIKSPSFVFSDFLLISPFMVGIDRIPVHYEKEGTDLNKIVQIFSSSFLLQVFFLKTTGAEGLRCDGTVIGQRCADALIGKKVWCKVP